MSDLLGRVLAGGAGPFALLYRPESGAPDTVDVVSGAVTAVERIADLPLRDAHPGHDLLALVPYRQIVERGFVAPDDGAPLLALVIEEQESAALSDVLDRISEHPVVVGHSDFDIDDEEYARLASGIISEEIGQGAGANFVLKRNLLVQLHDYSIDTALTLFRRLLERERGAYWTFLVSTGNQVFIGATPERHISVQDSLAVMNPISGTYRYDANGPSLDAVMAFLADTKESDELYMVVDEELKMMARICPEGGQVQGPYLKEMARLAHTEYLISGVTDRDPREILAETMFAPTVTGSPLENACRVIQRYEPKGRRYYSGVAALISADSAGVRQLDSAILIRTAEISADGALTAGTGATIVRHSNPASEAAETRSKAAGLLSALTTRRELRSHPRVTEALASRNTGIGSFWLGHGSGESAANLAGRTALVIDAEDTFTSMIGLQLRALGLRVDIRRFDEEIHPGSHDFLVLGPGPGDPTAIDMPKIAALTALTKAALTQRVPFLSICLSHQVLCRQLGLPIRRKEQPNQGVQRQIDLFGTERHVGFYNTFAAVTGSEWLDTPAGRVQISSDAVTGEVHALRAKRFASIQFHAESILTRDGVGIFAELLTPLATGVPVLA